MVILYEQHTHTIHHADIPKVLHLIGYNEFHHGNQRAHWLFVKDDTLLQLLPRGIFFVCTHTHTQTPTHTPQLYYIVESESVPPYDSSSDNVWLYKSVSVRWRCLPLCLCAKAAQLMITKYRRRGPRPARSRRGVTKLSGVLPYGPAEKWLTCAQRRGYAGEGGACWDTCGYSTQTEESDEWAGASQRMKEKTRARDGRECRIEKEMRRNGEWRKKK